MKEEFPFKLPEEFLDEVEKDALTLQLSCLNIHNISSWLLPLLIQLERSRIIGKTRDGESVIPLCSEKMFKQLRQSMPSDIRPMVKHDIVDKKNKKGGIVLREEYKKSAADMKFLATLAINSASGFLILAQYKLFNELKSPADQDIMFCEQAMLLCNEVLARVGQCSKEQNIFFKKEDLIKRLEKALAALTVLKWYRSVDFCKEKGLSRKAMLFPLKDVLEWDVKKFTLEKDIIEYHSLHLFYALSVGDNELVKSCVARYDELLKEIDSGGDSRLP